MGLTFVGLVFSKPILMNLGAQGAAIATVLGYVATDLYCVLWMGRLALALSLPLFCFPKALLSVFIQVNTVIEADATMLRWQCAGMVFGGLVLFFTVLFQTTGKMAPSYILSLSRQGIVFVVVLFVLKSAFGYSGILASQAVADWFSAAIALGLYRSVFVRSSQTLSLEK